MRKLLYVDVPFAHLEGGDKNRSKFIWELLSNQFDSDLLLIKTRDFVDKPIPEHDGFDQLFTLSTQKSGILASASIHQFSKENLIKFETILKQKAYEIIVFRFISCAFLACRAAEVLPQCHIVIDVDMLFSRLAEMSWKQNKTFKNRYFFIEQWKLKWIEHRLFHKPFHFFFTNEEERRLAVNRYKPPSENNFQLFPNMMPDLKKELQFPNKTEQTKINENNLNLQHVENDGGILTDDDKKNLKDKYILFFGSLNSVANQDAFLYLARDIYPLISKKLQEKDIKLYVVGKEPQAIHRQYAGGRLKLIGEVNNINAYISNSLFIVLPLRIASGTRTRILEAAALKKAVITTSIGLEGLSFSSEEVAIENKLHFFADRIIKFINNPEQAEDMGNRLYTKAISIYSKQAITDKFLGYLNSFPSLVENKNVPKLRLKIAIITNRFYPEVGGAETNIWFQALKLAEYVDVTVFCPKRIDKPRLEETHGIKVYRLFDIFNYPQKLPNLKAKTLCPELFFLLMSQPYNIIQCFPALNYNNTLAFIAAKLKDIPIILCSFDFLDYAAIIKQKGTIAKNILEDYQPNWKQKFLLKNMDWIFAISEKEMAFYQKYNAQVDYSPVPINVDEYEQQLPPVKTLAGINDQTFVFVCVGRVSHIKGQDIALKAFIKAYPEMPNSKLVFVGRTDYEPEYYDDLLALMRFEQLQDHVLFTGSLDRKETLAWLKEADIHVIPVRFMNAGAVVVESWMSDTPVLQSDVVDPNLVIEGYNGFLFKSENTNELAQQMIKAYQKKELLPQMAFHGKVLVKEKYTYDYLINLYLKTYEHLVSY